METKLRTFIEDTPEDSIYILVFWPWVQELMEYNWFQKECLLCQTPEDQLELDSAYFVPVKRLHEFRCGDMTNYRHGEE